MSHSSYHPQRLPEADAIPVPSSSDEELELEEVPIPEAGAPSSRYGTPTTTGGLTAGTTPGTLRSNAVTSEDDASEESFDGDGQKDDEVIRVQIGGETPEEKARRIMLSLRKWVSSLL